MHAYLFEWPSDSDDMTCKIMSFVPHYIAANYDRIFLSESSSELEAVNNGSCYSDLPPTLHN
jgi:hypothetical protein